MLEKWLEITEEGGTGYGGKVGLVGAGHNWEWRMDCEKQNELLAVGRK